MFGLSTAMLCMYFGKDVLKGTMMLLVQFIQFYVLY